MSDYCEELDKITDEQLNHKQELVDAFYDLSEEDQENVLEDYELEKEYIKDPEAEKQFNIEIRKKTGRHLMICDNEHCRAVLKNWKTNRILKEYVQDE